jgi:hypothetical protein
MNVAVPACIGEVGIVAGSGPAVAAQSVDERPVVPGDGEVVTTQAELCTGGHTVGTGEVEHLTREQYASAVLDLVGVAIHRDELPGDDHTQGFSLGIASSPLLTEAFIKNAESVAARADVRTLSKCDPAADATDACAKTFLVGLGRRAFRRSLTGDEEARLMAVYDTGKKAESFDRGLRLGIEALLAAPTFLYHLDERSPPDATGLQPLTATALASRLAFLVWGSVPDFALVDAAEGGQLDTSAGIRRELQRMLLEDPERAMRGFRAFYGEWLWLDQLDTMHRDTALFPAFTDRLPAALRASIEAQIDDVAWTQGARLNTIFSSETVFVESQVAPLFGLHTNGSKLAEFMPDPAQRVGILTHPALLSVLAKPDQSAPVIRGKFVREQLLCQKLPPPPPNVVPRAPDIAPGLSTRARFTQHATDPACAGCHQLMDPIGFSLEHFDALGQYRDTDQGVPIDASGNLTATMDIDGALDGARSLAERLAQSQSVVDCIATHFFRFAVRRTEQADDACSLREAQISLRKGTGDVKSLLETVVLSDAFRYRAPR